MVLLVNVWSNVAQAQVVSGDNLRIYTQDDPHFTGGTVDYIIKDGGGYISGYSGYSNKVHFGTSSQTHVSQYVSNSYVETNTHGVWAGSNQSVAIYQGALNTSTGYVGTPNGIYMDSSYTAMFSQGGSQTTVTGWVSSYANTSSLSQVNGMLANSSGVVIQSATALTLSGATISLTGATQINSTGTANTSVGNSTGTVTVVGSAVSIGSNSGSSLSLGSSSANSTVSLNGNRLQNVGNAVAGTDAVNLNQVNSLIGSTHTQLASMQQQLSASERSIAGVSAMANLPAPDKGQQYSVGVGLGSFRSQTALALGVSMKFHERWVGKVSASVSSGSYVTGAGLSYGF